MPVGDREESYTAHLEGDGAIAEDVRGSNIAGRDVTQTNIFQGVDPEEHAALLRKYSELKETLDTHGDDADGSIGNGDDSKPRIADGIVWSMTVGILKRPTVFATLCLATFLLCIVYVDHFPWATNEDIKNCKSGLLTPAEIHSDFEDFTCEEIDVFIEGWNPADTLAVVGLISLILGPAVLYNPELNPFLLLDRKLDGLDTPYRTFGAFLAIYGVISLFGISALLMLILEIQDDSILYLFFTIGGCLSVLVGAIYLVQSQRFGEFRSVDLED